MKHLWLLALVALCGCTSFSDVEQKRPYSCNWRDAGVNECPTAWRCGYDNRCFDPKVPVGLKTCKFTQDCFDGFRCSSDNACFNPAIEEARVCRESADCAPTWRCGIGGVCQNRNDAGPYPCGADDDCEQGWRCDVLAQVCANVTDTLFGEGRPVFVDRIHPLRESEVPAMVAMSVPSQGLNAPRVFFAVSDAGVRIVGKSNVGSESIFSARVPLPIPLGEISEVAAVTDQALFRLRSGEVYRVGLDGGFSRVSNEVERLKQVDPVPVLGALGSQGPALLVISKGDYVRLTTTLAQVPVDGGVVPGARLIDVAGVGDEVFVLRDFGVYREPSSRPIEECAHTIFPAQLRLPYPDGGTRGCGNAYNNSEPGAVVRLDAGVKFTLLATRSGDELAYAVLTSLPDGTTVGGLGYLSNSQSRVSSPIILCPRSAAPLQVSVSLADSTLLTPRPKFISRCPQVENDGFVIPASTWEIFPPSGNGDNPKFTLIDDDEQQWRQGARVHTTTSNLRVHAGRNELFWFDEMPVPGLNITAPFMLDRMPGALLRVKSPKVNNITALTESYRYTFDPNLGLAKEADSLLTGEASFVPSGGILGHPEWQITEAGVIDLANFVLNADQPRFLAKLRAGTEPLSSPSFGEVQTLADGTRLLLLVSGDRVLSADLTAVEANPYLPPAEIETRLVPSPGIRLRGLAIDGAARAAPDAGVTPLATGFLLSNASLFAFSAFSPGRWVLVNVPLPERFGSPIQLWSEKGRARLAYDRGTVMTLPERVPITSNLQGNGAGVISNFGRLCGTTYAMRLDGLYRSVHTDAGSQWQAVVVNEIPEAERIGAKLFEAQASMFIATRAGRVVELSLASNDAGFYCP